MGIDGEIRVAPVMNFNLLSVQQMSLGKILHLSFRLDVLSSGRALGSYACTQSRPGRSHHHSSWVCCRRRSSLSGQSMRSRTSGTFSLLAVGELKRLCRTNQHCRALRRK